MTTFEQLPDEWKTFCTKGHTDEHSKRCFNWMSPKGRKYREWSEVQTYFQLLNFEDDIPGVECRPENAKRELQDMNDGVTLEEDIKKDPVEKAVGNSETKPTKDLKRRRSVPAASTKTKSTTEEASVEAEETPKTRKRGRKKKDDEDDEDYVPEKESKASPVAKKRKSPPKDRNSSSEAKSNILDQAMKEATLDEISEVVIEDVDTKQILANHKIPEGLKIVNIDQPSVKVVEVPKVPPPKPEPSKPTVSSQGFSKATITPVPAQVSSSNTPSKPSTQGRTATPRSAVTQSGTPRAQAPGSQSGVRIQSSTTTPGNSRVRPATVRPVTPSAASARQVRPGTPMSSRAPTSTTPVRPPAPRQQTPQARQSTPQQQQRPQQPSVPASRGPQLTDLPPSLRGQVKFPCKVETNASGGGSLYRAAGSHCGLGPEGWLALRRYCHVKMLEWWQWYQPYYTFPLQVRVTVRNQTISKRILNPNDFVKFLKTDESLHSYYLSECELYCLANILGVAVNMLTYSKQEAAKWDTYDPHQGLVHNNKFVRKQPMYCLHDKNVQFSRIVQQK